MTPATDQPRTHRRVTHEPRDCPVCHATFTPSRSDQVVCSATCRKRRERGTYVVTAEDRAAMRRAAELVPIPLPPLAPEHVQAHILATAVRT